MWIMKIFWYTVNVTSIIEVLWLIGYHYIDGGGGSTHGSSGAAHASATNTTSDSPPTLATMFEILLPESSQWKNIGVMLSLDHGRLTAIEDQYRGVPNNCLREMLIEWLQQTNPQPTKSALIKAVKIFNSSLAETISTLWELPLSIGKALSLNFLYSYDTFVSWAMKFVVFCPQVALCVDVTIMG